MIPIPFRLKKGLLYVPITLCHEDRQLTLANCIYDTGSAGTAFDADVVETLGLRARPSSHIKQLMGIGGPQYVVMIQVDGLQIGTALISNVDIEIGNLAPMFHIDGIIGTDLISRFDWELRFSTHTLVLHDTPRPRG